MLDTTPWTDPLDRCPEIGRLLHNSEQIANIDRRLPFILIRFREAVDDKVPLLRRW